MNISQIIFNRIWFALVAMLFVVSTVSGQSYVKKHEGGDFYIGAGVGISQSLAENSINADFLNHQMPSANLHVGYNFNPMFGVRLSAVFNAQTSRCSKAAKNALPEVYGNGRYGYYNCSAIASGVFNLTNVFMGYEQSRTMTWSGVVGMGYIQTFEFDKKIENWNQYPYYPVDGDGGGYIAGHVGVNCASKVNKALDIVVELRTNVTDNRYNGVSNGNHLDFFIDLMATAVYHFPNKQKCYRFDAPPKEPFLDPVLRDSTDTYQERLKYGERMITEVPFYAGFYYLNEVSLKRVNVVAQFLKRNPMVCLKIVGHPDTIDDVDAESNKRLARNRAVAVRNALIERFNISSSRLKIEYDDMVLQPFESVREWVPSVHFVMVEDFE